jgi:hypothetical protein
VLVCSILSLIKKMYFIVITVHQKAVTVTQIVKKMISQGQNLHLHIFYTMP